MYYFNHEILKLIIYFYKFYFDLLRWEFKTDDHDIRFGILCTDIDGKETDAVPFRRVSSNKIDEVGVITCPAPATCKV